MRYQWPEGEKIKLEGALDFQFSIFQGIPLVPDLATLDNYLQSLENPMEESVKPGILPMLIVGFLELGVDLAYGADSLTKKQSGPTIQEHLTKETITSPLIRKEGTFMRKEGEYYYIKDNDGVVQKLHVDKNTKSDHVITGDLVKAYVTNQGHTATLQRDY